MKRNNKGFTLIELMIVVAIIGILAAVAMPRFANLIRKSNEGATKGKLGAIRSALSIYYADNEGLWPATLAGMCSILDDAASAAKYLSEIPIRKVMGGYGGDNTATETLGSVPDSTTGWMYSTTTGDVMVNVDGTDTKGVRFSAW